MELRRDALYFETGGTAAFYLYYQGTVSIGGEETVEYPEAIVAFKLDSFPQKFYSAMHGGEIRYKNSDFGVFFGRGVEGGIPAQGLWGLSVCGP